MPDLRRLIPIALLASSAACLSSAPPLSVRSFSLLAEPGGAPVAGEVRMAWYDPASGELGFYESWRWIEPPSAMLESALRDALNGAGDTSFTTSLHALWEVRGPEPAMRLGYTLDAPSAGREGSFRFDAREPLVGEGPDGRVAALRRLLERSIPAAAAWWNDDPARREQPSGRP
jgi:hypothetical protein